MASMFGPSPTPVKYTYNYSGGGSPYYGDQTSALYGFGGLPERTSLMKILKESNHLQLYGSNGMQGLGNATEVASTAAVTTGLSNRSCSHRSSNQLCFLVDMSALSLSRWS
jgi:hypothetical protein